MYLAGPVRAALGQAKAMNSWDREGAKLEQKGRSIDLQLYPLD
jgi:hypothetical protein